PLVPFGLESALDGGNHRWRRSVVGQQTLQLVEGEDHGAGTDRRGTGSIPTVLEAEELRKLLDDGRGPGRRVLGLDDADPVGLAVRAVARQLPKDRHAADDVRRDRSVFLLELVFGVCEITHRGAPTRGAWPAALSKRSPSRSTA